MKHWRPKSNRPYERHGHAPRRGSSATYISWDSMWKRATQPERHEHKSYRHVSVCARWRKFSNFLADMGERPKGKTLDRKNRKGNYTPSNCRWATPREQTRNSDAAKLTFEQAVTIAARRLYGFRLQDCVRGFHVDPSTAWKIANGTRWPDALREAKRRVRA